MTSHDHNEKVEPRQYCQHDDKLWADENFKPCEIESIVSTELIFVKMKKEYRSCPYVLPYGNSHICQWPERHDVFMKHKK